MPIVECQLESSVIDTALACGERGCTDAATALCAGCERQFCLTHVEHTTWYGGDAVFICVDCQVNDCDQVF